MLHAETGGFEFARGVVEVEGGDEFLLRSHAAQNLEMFRAVIFVLHNVSLLWPIFSAKLKRRSVVGAPFVFKVERRYTIVSGLVESPKRSRFFTPMRSAMVRKRFDIGWPPALT